LADDNRFIAVIGGSQPSTEEAKLAEAVGKELARQGVTVVCGGLGGVMEATCRGASAEGGITVGILPGNSRRDANPYVKIPVVTGMGYARNIAVVKSAQAVIAVGGSYGTLSEISYALSNGIPVVGLKTWALSKNDKRNDAIVVVKTPAEAVKTAIRLAAKA